jgi:AraC-like DNA-binding protein
MLTDGIDATNVAYEVGYESVSQFSREYSRLFGQPPMRDVKALRDRKFSDQRRVAVRPNLKPQQ